MPTPTLTKIDDPLARLSKLVEQENPLEASFAIVEMMESCGGDAALEDGIIDGVFTAFDPSRSLVAGAMLVEALKCCGHDDAAIVDKMARLVERKRDGAAGLLPYESAALLDIAGLQRVVQANAEAVRRLEQPSHPAAVPVRAARPADSTP